MSNTPQDMSDCELRAFALKMWQNLITTGDPHLSASDAESMGKKVKALQAEQMRLFVRLDGLIKQEQTPTEGPTIPFQQRGLTYAEAAEASKAWTIKETREMIGRNAELHNENE